MSSSQLVITEEKSKLFSASLILRRILATSCSFCNQSIEKNFSYGYLFLISVVAYSLYASSKVPLMAVPSSKNLQVVLCLSIYPTIRHLILASPLSVRTIGEACVPPNDIAKVALV